MLTFGELLKQSIAAQGLTTYGIAKDTGIDRSFLHGVFRGTKKLPQKRFNTIINSQYFTADQIGKLCHSYYTEKLGRKEMRRLDFIERGIRGSLKNQLDKYVEYPQSQLISNSFYQERENVLSLIYAVMNDGKINNFASNFPFSDLEINNIIFSICKKTKIDNFFHYVSNDKNDDLLDLEALFYSLIYAQEGYLTHRYYTDARTEFLPYFIVTDKHCLLFDEGAENAFLLSTEGVKDFISNKLFAIKNNCRQLVHLPKNPLEMMRLMDMVASENLNFPIIGYDNTFCPVFATAEILDAVATPFVKQNPSMIANFFSHYEIMLGESNTTTPREIIATHSSVFNFVKTGRVDSIPLELASNVPRKHRAEMLRGMISDDNFEYKLTNPLFFNSDYPFAYQIKNKSLTIISSKHNDFNEPSAYVGDIMYITEEECTVNSFHNFNDFFSKSQRVHSLAASRQIIQTFIDELEA